MKKGGKGGKMVQRRKRYLKKESAFREDPRIAKLVWLPGPCKLGICGEDAACIRGANSTHKCVCPSDLSAPVTEEMLCLTRKVVPLTPRPIFFVNVNGGNLVPATNKTRFIHQAEEANAGKAESQPQSQSGGGFVIGLLAFAMVMALVLGTVFWWKKKYFLKCSMTTGRRKNDKNLSPRSLSKGLLGSFVPNPQYVADNPLPVPVLLRDNLVFVQEIGEGCFGKVFRGELKKDDGTFDTVAIKVLKDSASKQAEEDFMREVEIMSSFHHANILSLLGIVLKDSTSRPWMVFEFMLHGDLAEVLRRNSRQFWKPVVGMKPLTKDSLLKIAVQIAGGMKYLSSQRFVHNDLACRNCLVGLELTVKIADFGMSRDVYTCDYYRIGGSKPVPLRWMSPESVMYRRFTLESDIYSYGVVLWEIYTFGKQPYYGLGNEEVIKLILQNVMLTPPEGCPDFVCDVMRACWKAEPRERITFPEIYDTLFKELRENKPRNLVVATTSSNETVTVATEVSLPRPPVFPVSPVQNESDEVLDAENYLAPQTAQVHDYLQPLPD